MVSFALLVALMAGVLIAGGYALTRLFLDREREVGTSEANCTAIGVDGVTYGLQPDQAKIAATIARVAINRSLPDHAVTVALATGMQESRLMNLDYGDADSLGVFQQRPSMGWGSAKQVMDVSYAAGRFYDHLLSVTGWETMPVAEAAQAVQRSAYPDRYADWEAMSRAWASALTGQTSASLSCRLEPAAAADITRLSNDLTGAIPGATLAKVDGKAGTDGAPETDGVQYTLTLPQVSQSSDAAARSRAIWQTASWLVTHARDYGISRIETPTHRWIRSVKSPTWQPDNATDADIIRITLG